MMSYFGLREWDFENTNIDRLSAEIRSLTENNGVDNTNLEFDMKTIDWEEYFVNYLPGIKKYVFKENSTNNEKCLRHYTRLRYMHFLLKSTFRIFIVYLASSTIWKYVLKYFFLKT